MSSTQANIARGGMASFHAAFAADDTWIEIHPFFDCAGRIPLLSSIPAGPFKAGMGATVPLWLALFLQQRSLCSMVPPVWLEPSNLMEIIAFEKSNASLFQNEKQLPFYYYEIAKRLTNQGGGIAAASTGSSSGLEVSVPLLIQDLYEIRVDKLRQQFQDILFDDELNAIDFCVTVTGIGSQELAVLQGFVQQALDDFYNLTKPAEPRLASTTIGRTTTPHADTTHPAGKQPAMVAKALQSVRSRRIAAIGTRNNSSNNNKNNNDSTPQPAVNAMRRPVAVSAETTRTVLTTGSASTIRDLDRSTHASQGSTPATPNHVTAPPTRFET